MADVTVIEGFMVKDSKAREEIEKIKNTLSPTKKYIFIGDSYADGYTMSGNVESWIIKTANILGLTQNETYFKNHLGGTGFVNSTDGKTFLNLLTDLNATITEKETITDIVVLGGFNDNSYEHNSINTAIETFINTAKTNYPNAVIHIGEIGWSPNCESRIKIKQMIENCYSKIFLKGARFISNIQFALHNYNWLTDDYGHPNEAGQESIANHLVQYLLTGKCDVILPEVYSNSEIIAYLKNDRVYLKNVELFRVWDEPITLGKDTWVEIFFNCDYIKGHSAPHYTAFNRQCVLQLADYTYTDENLTFQFKDGKLYARLMGATGGNYKTYSVRQIQIDLGQEIFNSYCV